MSCRHPLALHNPSSLPSARASPGTSKASTCLGAACLKEKHFSYHGFFFFCKNPLTVFYFTNLKFSFISYCSKNGAKCRWVSVNTRKNEAEGPKICLPGVIENIHPVLLSAMNGTGKEQGGLCSSDLRLSQWWCWGFRHCVDVWVITDI